MSHCALQGVALAELERSTHDRGDMAFKTFEECRQENITAARHLKRPCLRASIILLPVSSLSPSMCFQDCAVEPPPHPSTKTALLQSLIDYQYISFMTNAVGESLCLNDSYHNITYEHKYDCQYSTIPCGTSTQCNRRTLFLRQYYTYTYLFDS